MNQKPSIGRIVHIVLPDGGCKGEHRAAIVTNVHDGGVNLTVFRDQHCDTSNAVFTDGQIPMTVDVTKYPSYRVWNAKHSETNEPGTWHWPERVD